MGAFDGFAGEAIRHVEHLTQVIERAGGQLLLHLQTLRMLQQLPGQLAIKALSARRGLRIARRQRGGDLCRECRGYVQRQQQLPDSALIQAGR